MFEPRIIHLSHEEAQDDDLDFGVRESWTALLCCPADGAHWLVSWSKDGIASISREGGCECDDRILDSDDQPRQFRFTLHSDGDSGERWVCFGSHHHRFVCDEFGMGWFSQGSPTPCDGSCRAPVDSLPAPVAQAVQDFLDATERDG